MKIAFTGGGTGGHFYPIIAVAEEINKLIKEEKLVAAQLYYFAPEPYNEQLLTENNIIFVPVMVGKLRRYFSFKNFTDAIKIFFGIFGALGKLYRIYPDVVFSKGGYVSFTTLLAARWLGIPIIIHESDSHPGKVNLWSAKFARRVAISYPEASKYFPTEKTAITGNPIRAEVMTPIKNGAYEFLALDKNLPVIFVTGGSQGATTINDTLIDALPTLIEKYQIIHQVGKDNYEDIKKRVSVILDQNLNKDRYKLFDYLDSSAIKMAAGAAQLVVSRAGSVIFEIALWGLPSIIIPIPESISHDQRTNAFTFAASGGAVVIEQDNLTASVLTSEITRLIENPTLRAQMSQALTSFARRDAGQVIAKEIINLALEHEV
ncbi:MAG: undecaprenyldiphospho-muramoylpentapeptide beta-N-acetylglucosaminyltransferase [Patescibacteria group bacterium]